VSAVSGRRHKSHYRHMDRSKAEAIRRNFRREAKQAELAARYGVKQHTISRIVSGLVWTMADGFGNEQAALVVEAGRNGK
jgi:predicted DNA-binding protein (UPF0251 family)